MQWFIPSSPRRAEGPPSNEIGPGIFPVKRFMNSTADKESIPGELDHGELVNEARLLKTPAGGLTHHKIWHDMTWYEYEWHDIKWYDLSQNICGNHSLFLLILLRTALRSPSWSLSRRRERHGCSHSAVKSESNSFLRMLNSFKFCLIRSDNILSHMV